MCARLAVALTQVRGIEAVSRALESEAPSFCGCPARLAPESL